jgi:hypothetical protein
MLTDVEKDIYNVLKDRLNITEEEFALLPVSERNDWVEACKLARLLYENRKDELYEGYKDTDVFKNGEFDLVEATEMIRQKKNIFIDLEKSMNFNGSLPQFILLGENNNYKLVSEGLKNINIKNAIDMETSE